MADVDVEKSRRSSIERYLPKGKLKDTSNELSERLSRTSLEDEKPTHGQNRSNQNRRRGVNKHLYSQEGFSNREHFQNSFSRNRKHDNDNHQTKSWNRNDLENINFTSNNQSSYQPRQRQQSAESQVQNDRRVSPRKKNTETFKPSHKPTDMRILAAPHGLKTYNREITSRDVLVVNDLFCLPDDLSIYNKLLNEIKHSDVAEADLWQLWHGDSHLIADDKKKWKESCPTFHMIVNKMKDYFDMDIKATRLNWYRDSSEWKPFHHDAAAIKPDKARTQNLTVAVSFGAERDAAFEHATTKTVISMPQPNGTIYVFAKDVNVIWRHGILQCPPDKYHDRGRISIIAWGWSEQTQV